MDLNFNSTQPIYLQVANEIEEGILNGSFNAGTRIPSTTEISTTFHINPATVLKGMNLLVVKNLLVKHRGRGMFVTQNAKEKIKKERQNNFYQSKIIKIIREARELGFTEDDLIKLIKRGYQH
ncbi:GntR family transcriptional regulator [Philodulcilactobacillus myokoensis]|uniref:GntR family transcriptional regulator n=1 Tax=Philodulcilactobacillus myokoensis TaxID=2929573 RepID=A0A9W6B227_9LACO|nr:GntR family transcriptional regulator [Philodulcilactobacillus myokoensis]GLB47509.1 GntR family transcriptional regulator [Philodulcilactobacillus myokoensis]